MIRDDDPRVGTEPPTREGLPRSSFRTYSISEIAMNGPVPCPLPESRGWHWFDGSSCACGLEATGAGRWFLPWTVDEDEPHRAFLDPEREKEDNEL